jgi:transcriptional regulator with XRE-family HTH domain
MDVLKRIDEIMKKQHLNDYQLAKISGLSASTLSNMRKRNTVPSVATLEYICESLKMTLSQFFADETTEMYPVTPDQRDFLDYYILLSKEQQELLFEVAKNMLKK